MIPGARSDPENVRDPGEFRMGTGTEREFLIDDPEYSPLLSDSA